VSESAPDIYQPMKLPETACLPRTLPPKRQLCLALLILDLRRALFLMTLARTLTFLLLFGTLACFLCLLFCGGTFLLLLALPFAAFLAHASALLGATFHLEDKLWFRWWF